MGTILGPFDQDDFTTMHNLRADIRHLRKLNNPDWKLVIERETDTLRGYMGKVAA